MLGKYFGKLPVTRALEIKPGCRVQDAHVSARKCTRAELTRYFTITAKSIKANRNSGMHGVTHTYTRKGAQTEIHETARSSCGVIRSSHRPRGELSHIMD